MYLMKLLETLQKGARGSSDTNCYAKFFLTSKRVFYRPESGKFGHFLLLNWSGNERYVSMNAQIIFSDAPYRNEHYLKISHPYIEKRVFYRPESSFGLAPFFLQKAIFL